MATALTKRSVHAQTYDTIRAALFDGDLQPGEKITNRRLAELVGVSVTPIREALRRLVAEGALIELPNGSSMVPQYDLRSYLNEVGWLLSTMEAQLAARAAILLGAADIPIVEGLVSASAQAREAGDAVRAVKLWKDFSFVIFEKSDAPMTCAFVEQLWVRCAPLRREVYPQFDRTTNGRHLSAILTALQARDQAGAALAVAQFHAGLHEAVTLFAKDHPE